MCPPSSSKKFLDSTPIQDLTVTKISASTQNFASDQYSNSFHHRQKTDSDRSLLLLPENKVQTMDLQGSFAVTIKFLPATLVVII